MVYQFEVCPAQTAASKWLSQRAVGPVPTGRPSRRMAGWNRPYYHFISESMGSLLDPGWPGQSVSVAWNAGWEHQATLTLWPGHPSFEG